MKKVLMISPSCYPVTGAEAIVNIKLLKALTQSNQFCIDLVTRKRKWTNYPSDTLDSFGVNLNSLSIVEVDNVVNISTIYQNLMTYINFGILLRGYHWAYPAWRVVKHLVKNNQYDYVLTKDAPSLLLGYNLQKKFGLKWIATWNDPYPMEKYPSPYGKGPNADLSKMQTKVLNIMKAADIHIFPNSRLCNYMNKYLQLNDKQCCIVPHVIIPPSTVIEHKYSDKLRLIHSGNLQSPRNPETFLRGLRLFLDNNPRANILFTIMGHCDPTVKSLISDLKLDNCVSITPPVEYKESLRGLNSYDIAVIIEANCEEGIFLPTKVSDFMQMSIPIFAVSPSTGVLKDLYNNHNISYFASVDDVDNIYKSIQILYEDFNSHKINKAVNKAKDMTIDSVVEKYLSF